MGMDLILGSLVLVAAVRGWFRGFFAQAIRIGGLVGGVYLAGPIRDLARPIAAERLTSMAPDLLDRLLWWIAAVGSYVVLSGVATGILSASRRRLARDREAAGGLLGSAHRGDHSAGALFGAAKGLIVAAFLAGMLQQYAPDYLKAGGWAGEQVQTSYALTLTERHEPARRIWESEPVRAFVSHIREMGLGVTDDGDDSPAEESESGFDPRRILAADPETKPDVRSSQARASARRPAPLAVEPTAPPSASKPRRKADEPVDLQSALEDVRRDLERLDSIRNLIPR